MSAETDAIVLLCDVLEQMVLGSPTMHAPNDMAPAIAAARALVGGGGGGGGASALGGYNQLEFNSSSYRVLTSAPYLMGSASFPYDWDGYAGLPCTVDFTVGLHNDSAGDWTWPTVEYWLTIDGNDQSHKMWQINKLAMGKAIFVPMRTVMYLSGQGDHQNHTYGLNVKLQTDAPAGCLAEIFPQSAGYLLYPWFA